MRRLARAVVDTASVLLFLGFVVVVVCLVVGALGA